MIEYKINTQKRQHHDNITDNAKAVAQFVNEIKPFVNQSAKQKS